MSLENHSADHPHLQRTVQDIRASKNVGLALATGCALSLLFASLNSVADDDIQQELEEAVIPQVEIDTFQGPTLLEPILPDYPRKQLDSGEEAWVELNFMVDTEGKPYEIVAVDSIGHDSFRNAAIRAVKKWTYQPARYKGNPIDAGTRTKVVFNIENQPRGATDWFVRLQNGLRKAVSESDKKKADEYLDALEKSRTLTLYEDAFFNFAKYEYMSKWGTEEQQLKALDRAIAHESGGKYLPADVYVFALGKQLPLLLKVRDYQRAFITNSILSKQNISDNTRSSLERIKIALDELRDNQEPYDLVGSTNEYGSWSIWLFKDEFWLDDVDGRVVELKLRCDRDMRIIRYEPAVKYAVEKHVGACFLEVLGDAETTFRLFQS